MSVHPVSLDVVGYGPGHEAGEAEVAHFGFLGRLRRAIVAVALVWLVAVPFMLVPWLVILALPAAIGLSVYFFVERIRAPDVATECHGRCPDCGSTQAFDLPVKFELPLHIECSKCSRELTLEKHPAG